MKKFWFTDRKLENSSRVFVNTKPVLAKRQLKQFLAIEGIFKWQRGHRSLIRSDLNPFII